MFSISALKSFVCWPFLFEDFTFSKNFILGEYFDIWVEVEFPQRGILPVVWEALPPSRPPTSPLEVSWGPQKKHELGCRSLWESWCYGISPHSTEMEMGKSSCCFLPKSRLPFRHAFKPLGSQVSSGSSIIVFTLDVPETSSLHLWAP